MPRRVRFASNECEVCEIEQSEASVGDLFPRCDLEQSSDEDDNSESSGEDRYDKWTDSDDDDLSLLSLDIGIVEDAGEARSPRELAGLSLVIDEAAGVVESAWPSRECEDPLVVHDTGPMTLLDGACISTFRNELGELREAGLELSRRMAVVLMSDASNRPTRHCLAEWSAEVSKIQSRIHKFSVEVNNFWWSPHSMRRPSMEESPCCEAPSSSVEGQTLNPSQDALHAVREISMAYDSEATRLALEDQIEDQQRMLFNERACHAALLEEHQKALCCERASRTALERRLADQRLALSSAVSPKQPGLPSDYTELGVMQSDEVAYCWPGIRPGRCPDGVYFEAHVLTNSDKLSLAVADADGGGRCITFSPEDGIITREHRMSQWATAGFWVRALPAISGRFEGAVAVAVSDSGVEFFRRFRGHERWESTGRVADGLAWFSTPWVVPCLAFRDEGAYRVLALSPARCPTLDASTLDARWSECSWET